jgi:isopropylmalate/homocitrate/citramalate synthase
VSEPTPEERANRLPYWSPRKTLEELVAAEIRAAVEAERERCVRIARTEVLVREKARRMGAETTAENFADTVEAAMQSDDGA